MQRVYIQLYTAYLVIIVNFSLHHIPDHDSNWLQIQTLRFFLELGKIKSLSSFLCNDTSSRKQNSNLFV